MQISITVNAPADNVLKVAYKILQSPFYNSFSPRISHEYNRGTYYSAAFRFTYGRELGALALAIKTKIITDTKCELIIIHSSNNMRQFEDLTAIRDFMAVFEKKAKEEEWIEL